MTENERFRKAFVLLLVVMITITFVQMIRQFLLTILLAAIFSALMQPLYKRLLRLYRGRRVLASVTSLLLILVLIAGPVLFFVGTLASQALTISSSAGPWIERQIAQPDRVQEMLEALPFYDRVAPYRAEIFTKLGQAVGAVGNFLVSGLSATTRGTIQFFFQFSIMLYAMFFFMMDGRKIVDRVLSYIPLPEEAEQRMVERFVSVSRATVKGTLTIGIVQGALAGVGFAVAGIHGAVFWGTIMTVLSVIPGIGASLVWIPAVIYLFVTGKTVTAIILTLYCALIVGTADNLLRPRLVGRDAQMPDLLILFSTLGGLLMFGVVGFIVGPILAALFVTIWDIYGVVFESELIQSSPGETPSDSAS